MKWLVILDGPLDEAGAEVLRVAVGAVAAGAQVTIVASASVRTAIREGEVHPSAEVFLRTLRRPGNPWRRAEHADWHALLFDTTHLLRLARANRPAIPPLFVVTDHVLETIANEELARRIAEAGQIVRV